mgnify:CR=1 FL=1
MVIQYNIYSDSIYYYSYGGGRYSNATVLYDMRPSYLRYREQRLSTSTPSLKHLDPLPSFVVKSNYGILHKT